MRPMEDGDVQGRVVRPMEDGDVQGRVVRYAVFFLVFRNDFFES